MPTSSPFAELAETARLVPPQVALVLGSGMGTVAGRLRRVQSLPFAEVPGLTDPSVPGHGGSLTLGDWGGRRVLLFEGRLHYYEGHAWRDVVRPVRTAAWLGARVLVLTNAAGGIHDGLGPGCLMAIRDHVEWTRPYCWRREAAAARRRSPYSRRLHRMLRRAAKDASVALHEGTYAALTGPCYETPAEIRALRTWGADAVGMSTAREIRAGVADGMECAAVSCITNRAAGLGDGRINHEEVLTNAGAASERLAELLERFLGLLGPVRQRRRVPPKG